MWKTKIDDIFSSSFLYMPLLILYAKYEGSRLLASSWWTKTFWIKSNLVWKKNSLGVLGDQLLMLTLVNFDVARVYFFNNKSLLWSLCIQCVDSIVNLSVLLVIYIALVLFYLPCPFVSIRLSKFSRIWLVSLSNKFL